MAYHMPNWSQTLIQKAAGMEDLELSVVFEDTTHVMFQCLRTRSRYLVAKRDQKCAELIPALQRNERTGKYEEVGVYQFDSRGALRALEQLGKHFGMFDKKTTPSGGGKENNLLSQLIASTGEDLNTDDIPEIQ